MFLSGQVFVASMNDAMPQLLGASSTAVDAERKSRHRLME